MRARERTNERTKILFTRVMEKYTSTRFLHPALGQINKQRNKNRKKLTNATIIHINKYILWRERERERIVFLTPRKSKRERGSIDKKTEVCILKYDIIEHQYFNPLKTMMNTPFFVNAYNNLLYFIH